MLTANEKNGNSKSSKTTSLKQLSPLKSEQAEEQRSPDTGNLNQAQASEGTDPSALTEVTSSWKNKPLHEKIAAYLLHYKETGYIDFPALAMVARMASEGKVFTPDEAETKIVQLAQAVEQISQHGSQLQSQLEQVCSVQYYSPESIRQPLSRFDDQINRLSIYIEQQILPLVPLINKNWQPLMRSQFDELKSLHDSLLNQLELDVRDARSVEAKVNFHAQIHQISRVSRLVHDLVNRSIETIQARVPFYQQ